MERRLIDETSAEKKDMKTFCTAARGGRRRGSTLLWVLILATLLLTVTMGSFSLTTQHLRMQQRSEHLAASLHVAEAGAEHAILALNNKDWNGWETAGNWRRAIVTLDNHEGEDYGVYSVTIDDVTADNPLIVSTGNTVLFPTIQRSVRIKVRQELKPSFFDWGLYAYRFLDIQSNYQMDSYNSSYGTYESQGTFPVNDEGNIGGYNVTDAKFGSDGDVYGSLQVNGPVSNSDTTFHGDVINNSAGTPPPSFPDSELNAAKASNNNANIKFYKTGTTQLASNPWKNSAKTQADIGSDVDIVIPPGEYYFDYMFIGSKCRMIVSPPGEVNIWMSASSSGNDVLKVGSYCQFNVNTKVPANLNFKIKQGKITFGSNNIFYGTLYAPNSYMDYGSDNHTYGAFVARELIIQSNNYFHYDEALRAPKGGGGVLMSYWSEGLPPAYSE